MRLTTINAFFDASGKVNDHKIICIGCVGGYAERFDIDLGQEWAALMSHYGLKVVSGKDILNHRRPLSKKNPCLGLEARTEALLKFVACMRKHVQLIAAHSLDVEAFKKLPSHFFQMFGNDPAYMTFVQTALQITDFTPDNAKINFICDDDEEVALPFYHLFRRVKKVWPDARQKFASISFCDDRYLFGIQASDLVASLLRLETLSRLKDTPYDYKPVYDALVATPQAHENFLYNISMAIGTEQNLQDIAKGIKKFHDKQIKEDAEQQRVRELQSGNAATHRSSAQRDQKKTGRREKSKTKAR